MFSLIPAGVGVIFVMELFCYVMLMLYTKFQCSTMPGTGQKVCSGGWEGGLDIYFE